MTDGQITEGVELKACSTCKHYDSWTAKDVEMKKTCLKCLNLLSKSEYETHPIYLNQLMKEK